MLQVGEEEEEEKSKGIKHSMYNCYVVVNVS